ncbi:hypothetical protein KSP39_PZI009233 [Platanthera zijinensis]|uniref:Uncharacterized protein n=1 Tax=Platanthera zijinensis TaxID=2320716 RepID=A0AAP0BL23_9ASPA
MVYMKRKFGARKTNDYVIKLGDQDISHNECFKYLVQKDGGVDKNVIHKIQASWLKWRGAFEILCDRKVSLKLTGKFYHIAVRPTMLCDSECWAVNYVHEKK